MTPIELVLSKLNGVKVEGNENNQWGSLCPSHEDTSPSLAINVSSKGSVGLKCFAGCGAPDIVQKIGLSLRDLYVEKPPPEISSVSLRFVAFDKRHTVEYLQSLGLKDAEYRGKGAVSIPYRDADGTFLFDRFRAAVDGKVSVRQPKGVKLAIYGLWRLKDRKQEDKRLIVVEGESDCWALWKDEFHAIGLPGAGTAKLITIDVLAGFDHVFVWQEPGAAGARFAQDVYRVVGELTKTPVRVLSSEHVKDPAKLYENSPGRFRDEIESLIAAAAGTSGGEELPPRTFDFTDLGNADRYIDQHGSNVLYIKGVGTGGEWYVWKGTNWASDKLNFHRSWANETVRGIKKEAHGDKSPEIKKAISQHHVKSQSNSSICAMVNLVPSVGHITVEEDNFDREQHLFNVANGVIDLRTGELLPHNRNYFCRKISPVSYDPEATCPNWMSFLRLIFRKRENFNDWVPDEELIEFIRRFFGYCLTGSVEEQIIPIFWGDGSNGKSTLVNTILAAMGGSYSKTLPRNMLMEGNKDDNKETMLATLAGMRLGISMDNPKGKLDDSLIKLSTGGDQITARRLYCESFEFTPTHKMVMCTNHKPQVRGTDNGIWRRLRMVPFETKFWNPDNGETGHPDLKSTKDFGEKLKRDELPGILAWMVGGARDWYANKLPASVAVRDATSDHRHNEDDIQTFITETCDLVPGSKITVKDLYRRYVAWCEESGITPMNKKMLSNTIKERGYEVRTGTGNILFCHGISPNHKESDCYSGSSGYRDID